MTKTKKTINDPDLAKVGAAMQRAAQQARKIARDTGTPLVFYKDGQVVLQRVEEETRQEDQ